MSPLLCLLCFEGRTRDSALSNNRLKCADTEFDMIRNGDCHRAGERVPLHHHVAAALADHLESVLLQNATGVSSGEDAELTHVPLQSG